MCVDRPSSSWHVTLRYFTEAYCEYEKTLLGSAVVLYFIIGFEVLIMISPFAGSSIRFLTPCCSASQATHQRAG
jgi:hypothetical protein